MLKHCLLDDIWRTERPYLSCKPGVLQSTSLCWIQESYDAKPQHHFNGNRHWLFQLKKAWVFFFFSFWVVLGTSDMYLWEKSRFRKDFEGFSLSAKNGRVVGFLGWKILGFMTFTNATLTYSCFTHLSSIMIFDLYKTDLLECHCHDWCKINSNAMPWVIHYLLGIHVYLQAMRIKIKMYIYDF